MPQVDIVVGLVVQDPRDREELHPSKWCVMQVEEIVDGRASIVFLHGPERKRGSTYTKALWLLRDQLRAGKLVVVPS